MKKQKIKIILGAVVCISTFMVFNIGSCAAFKENPEQKTISPVINYVDAAPRLSEQSLTLADLDVPLVKESFNEKKPLSLIETTENKIIVEEKKKDTLIYNTEVLNIRTSPSLEGEIINQLPVNTEIVLYNVYDEWISFIFDDNEYYIHSDYIAYEPCEETIYEIINLDENQEKNFFRNKETKEEIERKPSIYTEKLYEPDYFKYHGVIYWNGYKWTWYSEKVLPGGGLKIPGRHVDENKYVCDEEGYICLASSDLAKGTIVDTPFGKKGKIYDCGCASGTLDVYTSWQ